MVSLLGGGLLGNPLSGALGGDKEEKEEKKGDGDEEEDPEIAEAIREAEEKRNDKYRKMEEEREVMRQGIRDKYGIQKKEVPKEDPGLEGRLGRKKKSPDDMGDGSPDEASAQQSMFPKNLDDLTTKVKELPGNVMTTVSGATEKCSLQ